MPNDQLHALYVSIGKELEMRKDVEQAGDWKNLQDALATYVRKWGSIIVNNYNDGETIYLSLSGYTTTTFGEIEIGG